MNNVFPSVLIPLLFNVLLLFASCAGKDIDNDDKSVTVIDLFAESGSAISNLSEIASNIEYIPLQTTINSLLDGYQGKVIRTNKTIFIQNRSEIVCFSPTGKFLYKLQNKGRGPGEYTDIADFDASYDNKFLALISNLNHKLLIYQISDTGLIFHHSLTLKSPVPQRISLIQGTEWIFLAIPPWEGSEPSLSLVINFSGDTISFRPNYYRYEPVRKINSRALNEMIVYSAGDNICFKEAFSDTVFSVNGKSGFFEPHIIFDSQGTTITPGMRGGSESFKKNTTFVAYMFETIRFVFFCYMTAENKYEIVFDRKTGKSAKLEIDNELKSRIKDDLNGGPDFNIGFLRNYCSDGKLFSFVQAIELKEYISDAEFENMQVDPLKKDEIRKIANTLNETDNPVLIVVTLKE